MERKWVQRQLAMVKHIGRLAGYRISRFMHPTATDQLNSSSVKIGLNPINTSCASGVGSYPTATLAQVNVMDDCNMLDWQNKTQWWRGLLLHY